MRTLTLDDFLDVETAEKKETKKPTIYDVAEKSNASLANVFRIIHKKDEERVPTETKQRILKVIDELGYKPENGVSI